MPGLYAFMDGYLESPIGINGHYRIVAGHSKRTLIRSLIRFGVHTLPHADSRIHVSRPIIIQPRLLIQFLSVKQIWSSVGVRMFLDKCFTPCRILQMLEHFTRRIGHVTRTSEMIGMEEVTEGFTYITRTVDLPRRNFATFSRCKNLSISS
jgi:hypothetical protein